MKQGFIHITQNLGDGKTREINVNIDNIDFYYDKRIVFSNRAIDVVETSKEITDKLARV